MDPVYRTRDSGSPPEEAVSTMAASAPAVPTVGEIARRFGVPVHKVEYVVRARQVQPIGWAGNARIFSEAAVDRIGGELRRIEEERGGEQ